MSSQTWHVPVKLGLNPPVHFASPGSADINFPAGLRHLCHKGPQAEISYVLNNWPPSLGSLSNSPSVYRPAQCSAALAGRIAVLEDLFAHGCPLFNEDGDETVSKAATEGAVRRENTTVLEFLLEKGWDSRVRTLVVV
ncbi:hypothetical protein GLAREA_08142 [Glarea lozoyensis ATCC 20868]|uniref:Ankyrin repeat-containing protein n=1 Tax=Glarea lozoyensis (strain ATCC 20868 / MF5171) TaxID=1116229 RepID=S3CWW5_GLAL2|nr:uncharacterized protein GLAREA_08142 [Glarea lozoyensis ATCC 20868]EPE24291.1 hypothetical protein GLAREA_08142 [Glarea lozoyensis ATCC 20868]